MSRATWFDSPFLLGFERMAQLAEEARRASSDGYPPYNIEEVGEGAIRITLAVAGFRSEELSAEVQGSQLRVSGDRVGEADQERAFVHRGIAARRFQRAFVLADGWEVEGARLENGLLHVDVRRQDAADAVRRIEIKTLRGA